MRIVTLQPFLTEIVDHMGFSSDLVGMTHLCTKPEGSNDLVVVTREPSLKRDDDESVEAHLAHGLAPFPVDLELLGSCRPECIFADCQDPDPAEFARWAEGILATRWGYRVKVVTCGTATLAQMYQVFELVGETLSVPRAGVELSNRIKAQLMDWGDNFYPRTKSKKVTVLAGVNPLRVAGRWVSDIIKSVSAIPHIAAALDDHTETSWGEIAVFRPDVIVVAPEGYTVQESIRTLRFLERAPEWEDIPAVKRGEVIFSNGVELYRPGPSLIHGAAILISAIAGFESGYISTRDDFYRLRFLELHRHRFL